MSDRMTGYVRLFETLGVTMAEGDRLYAIIIPSGETGITGTVIYDKYVPEFAGLSGTVSIDATISYYAPEITSLVSSAYEVGPTGTATITCVASDPQGSTLTYEWTISGGTGSETSVGVFEWEATEEAGDFTITCAVTNESMATSSRSVTISVAGVPTIHSVTASESTVYAGELVGITCEATDAYIGMTRPLSFVWGCTGGSIASSHLGPAGITQTHIATWVAPENTGVYTVSCFVSENLGGMGVTGTVDIEVI